MGIEDKLAIISCSAFFHCNRIKIMNKSDNYLISSQKENDRCSPWSWIPTLYFAEGLPYVVVMMVAVVMYMEMGMADTEIALYTSWLGLPWVIKPLWSPFVDLIKTKRWWILSMQSLLGAAFAGVAFTVNTIFWFQGTMFFFFLMAFSSATHDIAADGFYMLDLDFSIISPKGVKKCKLLIKVKVSSSFFVKSYKNKHVKFNP